MCFLFLDSACHTGRSSNCDQDPSGLLTQVADLLKTSEFIDDTSILTPRSKSKEDNKIKSMVSVMIQCCENDFQNQPIGKGMVTQSTQTLEKGSLELSECESSNLSAERTKEIHTRDRAEQLTECSVKENNLSRPVGEGDIAVDDGAKFAEDRSITGVDSVGKGDDFIGSLCSIDPGPNPVRKTSADSQGSSLLSPMMTPKKSNEMHAFSKESKRDIGVSVLSKGKDGKWKNAQTETIATNGSLKTPKAEDKSVNAKIVSTSRAQKIKTKDIARGGFFAY